MESAVKNGIVKKSKFKFAEFDIADMYRQRDGTLCYSCVKGKACAKHKLMKKDKMVDEEDFERG